MMSSMSEQTVARRFQQDSTTTEFSPGRNSVQRFNTASQAWGYIIVGTCVLARTYTKTYLSPPFRLEDCKGPC